MLERLSELKARNLLVYPFRKKERHAQKLRGVGSATPQLLPAPRGEHRCFCGHEVVRGVFGCSKIGDFWLVRNVHQNSKLQGVEFFIFLAAEVRIQQPMLTVWPTQLGSAADGH